MFSLYRYESFNHAENGWWAQQDSNLRHADYESAALPTELWARSRVKSNFIIGRL